jgi:hypothetical protein
MYNLKSIEHLHIDQNKFVGPLPSEIGSMRLSEYRNNEKGISLPFFLVILLTSILS